MTVAPPAARGYAWAMDQAPYRSMPAADTAALVRENRILRGMLRVVVAVFVILSIVAFFIAMATSSVRAEVGLAALLTLINAIVVVGRALADALRGLATAMSGTAETTGVRVAAGEAASMLAPAASPEKAAALKKAIAVVRDSAAYRVGTGGAYAEHQMLLAQLHEVESTGRLATKR